MAVGLVFAVLGSLQTLLTDADPAGSGMATGGVIIMVVGGVLWALRTRRGP